MIWVSLFLFAACNPNAEKLIKAGDEQGLIALSESGLYGRSPEEGKRVYSALAKLCGARARSYILKRYEASEDRGEQLFLFELLSECRPEDAAERLLTDLLNRRDMNLEYEEELLTLRAIEKGIIEKKIGEFLSEAEKAAEKSPGAVKLLLGQAENLAALAGMEKTVAEKKSEFLFKLERSNLANIAQRIAEELDTGYLLTADALANELRKSLTGGLKSEAEKLYLGLHQLKITEDRHFNASIKAEKNLKAYLELKEQVAERKKNGLPLEDLPQKAEQAQNEWRNARSETVLAIRAMNASRPRIKRLKTGYDELAKKLAGEANR